MPSKWLMRISLKLKHTFFRRVIFFEPESGLLFYVHLCTLYLCAGRLLRANDSKQLYLSVSPMAWKPCWYSDIFKCEVLLFIT
jgi:hypothetical protein